MVLLYTVRSSDKRASRLVLVDEWKGLGCERGWCGRENVEEGNKKFKGEIWMIDYLQMLLGKGFATSLDSLSRRCHELLTAVKNMRSSALHFAGATA